jgi:hypothetical protein
MSMLDVGQPDWKIIFRLSFALCLPQFAAVKGERAGA